MKECLIAKNARGAILSTKGNDHNVKEAITNTLSAEYENLEEFDARVKQIKMKELEIIEEM